MNNPAVFSSQKFKNSSFPDFSSPLRLSFFSSLIFPFLSSTLPRVFLRLFEAERKRKEINKVRSRGRDARSFSESGGFVLRKLDENDFSLDHTE